MAGGAGATDRPRRSARRRCRCESTAYDRIPSTKGGRRCQPETSALISVMRNQFRRDGTNVPTTRRRSVQPQSEEQVARHRRGIFCSPRLERRTSRPRRSVNRWIGALWAHSDVRHGPSSDRFSSVAMATSAVGRRIIGAGRRRSARGGRALETLLSGRAHFGGATPYGRA